MRLPVFLLIFSLGLTLLIPEVVYAAKPRVRATTAKKTAPVSGTIYSKVKLARPNIVISFYNLDKVKTVNYILSYVASGLEQGAGGAVSFTGSTADSRTLYFGTCSRGACTPHTNIKNAQLLVTTTLKSGSTHTKLYRIKY